MGNMKANRKFVEEEEAVSAVIGVILMVAITVAIAATVYVYVSGMLTTGSTKTPDIAFLMDDTTNTLTVTKISSSNVLWSSIICVNTTGTASYAYATTSFISAGQAITGCTGSLSVSYQGSTLLGTWTFSSP